MPAQKRFKVGVTIHPQQCTIRQLRDAWLRADELGETRDRLRTLREALPRIKARISKLQPGPAGPMPILIGGGGERVTLRLVAEHAQMWNALGSPEEYAHKSKVLDEWCSKIGRDPK